ncbi:hypothetical protein KGF54_001635 [Candida jiufengensis]|uniref:uncharacterized protein n=1 Tax=Candida jiufengensis TaxID=497108 RepID=UPI002223F566|nr:uncharacterized protein KGF54_001635 [Candida jiufengensis]KAI5955074.1 hypothetical protein KGF54_001635 [Candida jiufengensis]
MTVHKIQFLLITLLSFLSITISGASLNRLSEYGTYMNPNPRKNSLSSKCEPNDLVKLSSCCNDILSKLDECKPNDLACECCALQSINQECYHLCPGNPNTNFLTVLLSDCKEMNKINACSLPFKKEDSQPPRKHTIVEDNEYGGSNDEDPRLNDGVIDASLQSKIYNVESLTERPFKSKKIKLLIDGDDQDEDEIEKDVEDDEQQDVIQNKDLKIIDHDKDQFKSLNGEVSKLKFVNLTTSNNSNLTNLVVAAKKSDSDNLINNWNLFVFFISAYFLLSI